MVKKKAGSTESSNVNKKAEILFAKFRDKFKTDKLNTFFIFGAIILISVIALYAIFSPTGRNLRGGNPACGKIVIAADTASLNANVSPTLSGARYFLVMNPLTKKLLEVVKNPYVGTQSSKKEVAYFVAGKGEEAVIAGSVDPRCYIVLNNFGVRAFGGYDGKIKDAVDLYRQARISHGPSTVGTQVAFSFGKQAFICPACNWQTECVRQGNTYPNCPNCGLPMAKDMSAKRWNGGQEWNPAGFVAETNAMQGSPIDTQAHPNFWQGPESAGFFICPSCNWRMYTQKEMGQYPKCPNCKVLMARGGVFYHNYQNPGLNTQPAAFTNNFIQAPPIYSNATMPHGYKGVCSNCHHIIKSSQNTDGTQAAWGGGTCVLR